MDIEEHPEETAEWGLETDSRKGVRDREWKEYIHRESENKKKKDR